MIIDTLHQKNAYQQLPRVILLCLCGILFLLLATAPSKSSLSTVSYQEQGSTGLQSGSLAMSKERIITLEGNSLFLTQDMLENTDLTSLRPYIIRQLIAHGFTRFQQLPYAGSGNNTITSISMGSGFEVLTPITELDDLDIYLEYLNIDQFGTGGFDTLFIPEETWSSRSGVYLFKTTQDLKTMGYEVVSHRTRVNKDQDYRRFNIAQSFKLLGNVRILLPDEEFDFMVDAQYDEFEQKNYKEGYAIIEGEEEKDYGGGICGASTAIYQGILTNKGLDVTKLRNHTKRFSNLYNAYINHEEVATPGIDSAVYYGLIDLKMINITPNPVILIMNYDGVHGNNEEVFTLSLPVHQGNFEFVRGGGGRSGGCYTWLINDKEETNCYKEVR